MQALEEGIDAEDVRRQKDVDAEAQARSKRQAGRRRKRPVKKKKPRAKPLTKSVQPKISASSAKPALKQSSLMKIMKPKAATKKAPQKRKAPMEDSESASDYEDTVPLSIRATATGAATKKAPQKRKPTTADLFDTEDSESASDFEDTVPLSIRMKAQKKPTRKAFVSPKRRTPSPRKPVRKPAVHVLLCAPVFLSQFSTDLNCCLCRRELLFLLNPTQQLVIAP